MAAVQISSYDCTLSNIFLCEKNATWCHLVQSFYIRENTAARWIAVVDRGSPNLPKYAPTFCSKTLGTLFIQILDPPWTMTINNDKAPVLTDLLNYIRCPCHDARPAKTLCPSCSCS